MRYLILLAGILAFAPRSAWAVDDICKKAEKEADGEVVVVVKKKGDAKGAHACAFIDAPAEAVYAVMTDYPSFPKWMDKLDKINPKWVDDQTAVVDYELGTLFGTYKYTQKRVHIKPTRVDFERVAGDFKTMVGRYEFFPIEGTKTSYMVIETYVDAGMPIPGFIENYFSQKGSRRLFEDVRDEVAKRMKK